MISRGLVPVLVLRRAASVVSATTASGIPKIHAPRTPAMTITGGRVSTGSDSPP